MFFKSSIRGVQRKKISLGLFGIIILTSCGKPNVKSAVQDQKNSDKLSGFLGAGWDSDKQEWLGECAEGEQAFEGKQEAQVSFDKSMEEKEAASSLGFGLDAKARYGVYEGDLAANFARETASSAFSETATYQAVYKFKNIRLKNAKLKKDIGEKANNAGPEQFVKTCGHQVATQAEIGARFFVNIKMDFSTAAEKQSFSANIGLKGPAFQVRSKIEQASSSLSQSASVKVRLFQQGGNVSRITKALSNIDVSVVENNLDEDKKTASALVICSMERLDACLKVIDSAIKYATDTNEKESFPNQINFDTLNLSSANGPAILSYITSPWSSLAVYPPDPFTAADVKEARKDLFAVFEKQLVYKNRIDDLMNGPIRLSPKQNINFSEKKASVYANIEKIVEAGKTCFTNINDCMTKKLKVMQENNPNYLAEEFDVLPETFAQHCDMAQLPIHRLSHKHTVDKLSEIAKIDYNKLDGGDKCKLLGEALEGNAMYPGITELYLGHSDITSLAPIGALKNLKVLVLRDNKIKSLDDISGLVNLEKLVVTRNGLVNADAVFKLPRLKRLGIYSNKLSPTDIKKLQELKNMDENFVTTNEVCEHVRNWALKNNKISQEEFEYFSKGNWGPELKEYGNWETADWGPYGPCTWSAEFLY
jgi:Leucine-rich repeat (LRR) protein